MSIFFFFFFFSLVQCGIFGSVIILSLQTDYVRHALKINGNGYSW